MRVATNSISESLIHQIQQLGSKQAKLQNQVATGQRIFQAEDDPGAIGRVLNLETEQRQLTQFSRNSSRALELSQATYASLRSIKKVSDRATEIGTLAGGIVSPDAATAYSIEVNQLIEQTLQLANTSFRNEHLFAGTAVDAAPFTATRDSTGKLTAAAFVGNTAQASIQLTENSSLAVSSGATTNAGIGAFLTHLVSLRDALAANSSTAITAAQTNLIADEDTLVSALAEVGGVQTRIESVRDQQLDRADSLESLISSETDVDLPSTIVKLSQTQTAYQAALQSAANIMKRSLLDYLN